MMRIDDKANNKSVKLHKHIGTNLSENNGFSTTSFIAWT